MIQAKELRIGNIVVLNNQKYHLDKTGKNFMIDSIKTDDVSLIEYENMPSIILYQYLKYIDPIPLTEEWLVKFGFKKSNRLDLGELKPCYVIFSLAVMLRHNSFFIDWIGGNTKLNFVHQLQNLYFSLTNKELNL